MMVSSMVAKSFSIKNNYEVSVMNIEMNLEVEANVMAGMDDMDFTCLMSEVYKQKAVKAIMMEKDDDEDN